MFCPIFRRASTLCKCFVCVFAWPRALVLLCCEFYFYSISLIFFFTSKQVNIRYAHISFFLFRLLLCFFLFSLLCSSLYSIALYELMLCKHSNDIDTDFFLYLFQLAVCC